jgi:hypothetical protein
MTDNLEVNTHDATHVSDTRAIDSRQGFLILQVMRISGIAFAFFGLAVIGQRILLPPPLGYALLAIGMVEALVVPTLLARKWRSR